MFQSRVKVEHPDQEIDESATEFSMSSPTNISCPKTTVDSAVIGLHNELSSPISVT
ncbi:hypothetical protein MKX03_012925, partial [Papaver bracteatum]